MTEPGPTVVSMRDLLASCEAAKAVSRPPRAPEDRPEGARGPVDHATAAGACPATTNPQPPDGTSRHSRAAA
ncbi:hypothetical protein ACIBJF_25295 [Streptomyces sp. NPDC050743]|uniref:hypothetical protein n=1 Tax=Streptomyces sp. NPDC050743 TaxID=3365634 RepID=UPI0037A20635